MSDQRWTMQDLLVAGQYMRTKKKLWAVLKPVSDHMVKVIPSKIGNGNTYSTASMEETSGTFSVSRFIDPDSQFTLNAGFEPTENEGLWAGVWLSIHPKCKDQFNSIKDAAKKTLSMATTKEEFGIYGKWTVFEWNKDSWCIALKGKLLSSYTDKEQGINALTEDLVAWIDEVFEIKKLSELSRSMKKVG